MCTVDFRFTKTHARLCQLVVTLIFVMTTSCTTAATPDMLPPSPTLQSIRMGYSPALRPWAEKAAQCAENLRDVAFFPIEIADEEEASLEIRLLYAPGFEESTSTPNFMIGEEDLVFITNTENSIPALDLQQLEAVFSGRFTDWRQISGTTTITSTMPVSSTIVLYIYPAGDPLQSILTGVLKNQTPPQARLVPDPEAMLQAVSNETGGLGYVPESWLQESSTVRQIEASTIRVTTIAQTSEPTEAIKALLVCVQKP